MRVGLELFLKSQKSNYAKSQKGILVFSERRHDDVTRQSRCTIELPSFECLPVVVTTSSISRRSLEFRKNAI